jgi:ribosome-associated protein YbcJ (S4-like RNA binding protein)
MPMVISRVWPPSMCLWIPATFRHNHTWKYSGDVSIEGCAHYGGQARAMLASRAKIAITRKVDARTPRKIAARREVVIRKPPKRKILTSSKPSFSCTGEVQEPISRSEAIEELPWQERWRESMARALYIAFKQEVHILLFPVALFLAAVVFSCCPDV